jgi:4-amino-4-deoxy-L-arabinose transferase-like glycosyltransferase
VRVSFTRRDGLALALVVVAAGALRLVALPGRGEWDDDQGGELLTMLYWVRGGPLPEVGPLSSFGTAHHGVAYYWLLAPGAFLTDVDPVVACATTALIGVAGVAATWWLGREIGGSIAGYAAGLLAAVSPAAIGASTFVWNSNVEGPAAALAAAAGWRAWRTRQAGWWMVAMVGVVVLTQAHLAAALAAPPLVGLAVADVMRRKPQERRRMLVPMMGVIAIALIGYLPLLIHEVHHNFSESQAILDYLVNGARRARPELAGSGLVGLPVIAWRVLASPVSGFVQSAPLAGFPALFLVATAVAIATFGTVGVARQFGRWALGTTVWVIVALALITPSLAILTPGLPNDQYHAWLDPILIALVGVAIAYLLNTRVTFGWVSGATILTACVILSLVRMPPLKATDGGWPAAVAASDRVRSITGDDPVAVTGVAKAGTALTFPLQRDGVRIVDPGSAKYLVVVCDPLFERAVGVPCGGPAETSIAQQLGFPATGLMDRFSNSPRRVVCVFAVERPAI